MPSFVTRDDFFPALAIPFVRKIPSALVRSPPLSTRARLQSMKPALVFSRSCFTSCGSISVVVAFIESWALGAERRTVFFRLRGNGGHFYLLADRRFVAARNHRAHERVQN